MHASLLFLTLLLITPTLWAQDFGRTRIQVGLENPWEITYGPDDHLWVSEQGGRVIRVDPQTKTAEEVFRAGDYFPGSDLEKGPCGLGVGANTFGLALHPDFSNPATAFVYLIYSYNSGTEEEPRTLFKLVELKWGADAGAILESRDLVTGLANGYDHFGGRLIAVRQQGKDYLYYSTGDTGSNRADCYDSPADNPNTTTQDPYTKVGKVHRVFTDGTVPPDNPIPGNTFFTRGHRNPQGLAYNPNAEVVYAIEHGHTTDDEVNVLDAGMNYGWKDVQGYHDGNYPDELAYVADYQPHPDVPGDELREPLFAWGAVEQVDGGFPTWPTVAPSDGIFYGSDGIPGWDNSLLVVTLKNGTTTDQELYRFKLTADGRALAPSTPDDPNPATYFGDDQIFNGRLRDIAVSPDGKQLFLITNNRNVPDPIIVYTLAEPVSLSPDPDTDLIVYAAAPNPFTHETTIRAELRHLGHLRVEVVDALGRRVRTLTDGDLPAGPHTISWDGSDASGHPLPNGLYRYILRFDQTRTTHQILLAR